ncbi:type II secretion system F family protein [Microbacterium halotolerans]|uniref:type II secretion system F family protein n=1 Tax=Microbacterium halotolerans TaxID=246613 RepID=UPI001F08AB55|nr:pilus assembly protein TadB [Microbacterium halotolerans]
MLRLSALLEAGAVPQAAWRHLAESGDAAAQRIADRADRGAAVAEAIGGEAVAPVRRRWGRRAAVERDRAAAWRDIAAAWEIAATVGAPLAESLRGMSRALRDAQETLDDVRVAMAEPTHTARLMSVLPFVGVFISLALGFDMIGVLTTPGAGLVCLSAGLAMVAGGRLWTSGLIRAARPAPGTPGLYAELTAIALGGGVSLDRARALVSGATGAAAGGSSTQAEASATGGGTSADDEVERVLDLSRRAGIPAIDLLRATAEQQRSAARTDGRVRAARLGTRLLLPLGACTLPAFLCLGVVPMLLAVLQTTSFPDL